ncbi:MAG: hypothetical protein U0232_01885 [Thermomicrobiales bacterium]
MATLSGQAQVVVLTQVLEKVVDVLPRQLAAACAPCTPARSNSANGLVLSRRTMPQS